jgi:hypothetical protein
MARDRLATAAIIACVVVAVSTYETFKSYLVSRESSSRV